MKALFALIHSRNLEFVRDRSALGWSLAFPLILVIALALVFDDNDKPLYQIGVVGQPAALEQIKTLRHIEFIQYDSSDEAQHKVARHLVDLAVTEEGYWVNPDSARGDIVEQLVHSKAPALSKQIISGSAVRHVEWLLPGIIGMNMMFSALYGVGYVVIRYRRSGVLKRLQVTPLGAYQFLASQMLSRLLAIVATATVVFVVAALIFDIRPVGNPLLLLVTMTLGTAAMISIGLLVASATRSEEFGNGVLNLLSWPMMFLSGIWFSLEGSKPWVRIIADFLPLTHLNDANRAIIIDGANLVAIGDHLLVLTAITIGSLVIAGWRFKWQ
ncbi:ABC transporter permease [Ferrimonas lipolytica]|uniref:Transport permease protein n=1 Tax=Ferrimonas lipolytica TaxID=2724191 RepID=A0A6H1UCB9_9GAMM|nr:ABC transporter permease [Ferrimonas lipolytica]QIZ76289.1 ABC transporter permease [Ferrimonas lipolytica]